MSGNAETKREIIFLTFEEIFFWLTYHIGLSMRKAKHNRLLRRQEPNLE